MPLWALVACAPADPAYTPAGDAPGIAGAPAEPATSAAPPPSVPGAPSLLLNEVMTRNDSTVMDADGGFPDWVEIVNRSDAPVALDRLAVRGDQGAWTGGAGELAPGAVLLLLGELALDGDGDHLDLLVDGAVVDSLATGAMGGDLTWGRYPDGGAWAYTDRASPGWTNGSDPGDSRDPSAVFFREDDVTDVYIGLSDAAWSSLEADPYTEVPGTLAWGPAFFPEVHVRRKGVYGSLRGMSQKAAFKVDVGDFGQRLRGLEALTLNNMVQDPTYVHEAMTYAVYRACGLPAPRVGYTRVWVNDTYFGLYANVETVDDTFLARWFADPTGNLYEGAYGVDFYAGYEPYFECDECADPDDRSDLTAVVAVLDQDPSSASWAELQALVDMDAFLTYMAVEAMVWHWDGYTTSNNYRVYHDPRTGRFFFLPWGTDQTWVDEWYGPFDAGGRIFRWCMAYEPCVEAYTEKMVVVADTLDATDVAGQMNGLLGMLAEDIAADPRKEWSQGTRQSYLQRTRDTLSTTADRMREEAASR